MGGDWLIALATVVAGLVGAVGALVGVRIGKRRERENAQQEWLREKRFAAYSEFLASIARVQEEVIATVELAEVDGRKARYDKAVRTRRSLHDSLAKLEVLGTEEVWEFGCWVSLATDSLLTSISSNERVEGLKPWLDDDDDSENIEWPEATWMEKSSGLFRQAARRALGATGATSHLRDHAAKRRFLPGRQRRAVKALDEIEAMFGSGTFVQFDRTYFDPTRPSEPMASPDRT